MRRRGNIATYSCRRSSGSVGNEIWLRQNDYYRYADTTCPLPVLRYLHQRPCALNQRNASAVIVRPVACAVENLLNLITVARGRSTLPMGRLHNSRLRRYAAVHPQGQRIN
ncbi:hypothetical protein KCP75_05915 [Salmonella enterica subsp. enterica]|nr:hypothetical protein KCP75_05915 [Salmonella enterica subsp. enterica]